MGYKSSGIYGGYGIYSDDGGHTWSIGYDQPDTSGKIAYIEGTIAELPDGTLFISYRDKTGTAAGTTRYCAYSTDGGESLVSGFVQQSALKIHSVQGSALDTTGTYAGQLLFSAPTLTSAFDPTLRRDMGIYVSKDSGRTWSLPYLVDLESKPAAYSDLVQLDDTSVGILYETGTVRWREQIMFRRVSIAQITNPTKVVSSVKAQLSTRSVPIKKAAKLKVLVRVGGIGSPPGEFVVKYLNASKKRVSIAVPLTYSNKGLRYISLPVLKKGVYPVSVYYQGTRRIRPSAVYAGYFRVGPKPKTKPKAKSVLIVHSLPK